MKEDTFAGLIASFCEFLLVAIHTIIHERAIYPANLFLAARKYNHPLRQARHPRVCRWIQDAVDACSEELIKSSVSKICLVIISADNTPVERFVFDVSTFPEVPLEEIHTPFAAEDAHFLESNLELQYRAALVKLSLSAPKLGKLPPNCTYSVAIELRDNASAPEGNPPPWIVAEHQNTLTSKGKIGKDDQLQENGGAMRTIPVRSLDIGPLSLEVYIEEGRIKQQTLDLGT